METSGRSARPPITDRQRRVLRLLCHGATDRQIAIRICASERTVQREIGLLRMLYGASSRTQLAAIAMRSGFDPGGDA